MTDPPINERDFASLIKQHSRIINKVSYFYATDKLPFDDLRQEIYVNIWLGLKQFRGDSKISTWIYRVAVNSALMALRSSKSTIGTVSVDFGLLDLSSEIDDAQKENLQVLHSLINRLEDMEKAIILLWLDEYSYDEIHLALNAILLQLKSTVLKTNSQNRCNMKLNELKKSMSTLEQVLAKTNTDIKINVSASKTAQTKILKEFRKAYTSLLLVAIIFVAAAIYNINPISFPLYLKIYLSSFLAIGAIWYIYLYRKLKSINIAVLSPKQLFSKTATIKLLTLAGEIFIGMCLVSFFALLLPSVWTFHRIGFWIMTIGLILGIVYSIFHYWPQYVKLFRDLNSIKE